MKDGIYKLTNPSGLEFEDIVEDGITVDGWYVEELKMMGYEFELIKELPQEEGKSDE